MDFLSGSLVALLLFAPQGPEAAGSSAAGDPVEEAYAQAEAAPPGTARNAALARWLDLRAQRGFAQPPAPERVLLAWEGWVEAAKDLRFDEALAIGRPLHAETRATWSAISLALSLNRSGRVQEADFVLAGQAQLEPEAAALWNQRGIYALATGDEDRAMDYLNQAIDLGSADARAVVARHHLALGRWEQAREGFRRVLEDEPTHPWAARGWGLAVLSRGPGFTRDR